MTYDEALLFALSFWAIIFGVLFGLHDEKSDIRVYIAREPPTKAPPPEAFEKDYD